MPDQDKLLTRQNAFRETLTEVLGLKLADEVIPIS